MAVVRNLTSDHHTKQFLDGARSEGESFGFKVDTFISDGDDAKFQELVAQAIQKGYDGYLYVVGGNMEACPVYLSTVTVQLYMCFLRFWRQLAVSCSLQE